MKNLSNENYIAKLGWNSIIYIYIYIKRTNLGQNADSRFAALKQDTTN